MHDSLSNYIAKLTSFEDPYYTIRGLIEIYILMKITSILCDKIILLIILNVIILFSPIEKKIPHFIFKWRIGFRQIIDSVLGIIDCFIPIYGEELEK